MTTEELIEKLKTELLVKLNAAWKQCDEARAEIDWFRKRDDASCDKIKKLTRERDDARAEVAQLRAERDEYCNNSRAHLYELLQANTDLAKDRDAAKEDASRLRNQLNSIQKVISDAGFSEVIEPLERVTRLIQERDNAIYLADKAENEVARLKRDQTKSATINQQLTVRPEPSRLEIAAMLVAGRFFNTTYVTKVSGDWIKYAFDGADKLIAAAKEEAK
jgi:uncharacterized coiled-coil DUF342 family protein